MKKLIAMVLVFGVFLTACAGGEKLSKAEQGFLPPPTIQLTVVYPDGESFAVPSRCPVPAELCWTGIDVYARNGDYTGLGYYLPVGTPIYAITDGEFVGYSDNSGVYIGNLEPTSPEWENMASRKGKGGFGPLTIVFYHLLGGVAYDPPKEGLVAEVTGLLKPGPETIPVYTAEGSPLKINFIVAARVEMADNLRMSPLRVRIN